MMLDYRLDTFLVLAQVLSYTRTAQQLHITQPAVTQHIKALESLYGVSLFHYEGKRLSLSASGLVLYEYAVAMKVSSDRVLADLALDSASVSLRFGTTLTIGEYVMPDILERLLVSKPALSLSMIVNNTHDLLESLVHGDIDFAVLEGHFDKSKYGFSEFRKAEFVGVCGVDHRFAGQSISFSDILGENVILRESGSGTRSIFEQILFEQNFSLESLAHYIEIGNMRSIKHLLEKNLGISFLYKDSILSELDSGRLSLLSIKGFDVMREYNFVYLKGSLHAEMLESWFSEFRKV